MRALSRQLPIPALAVVLAIACAACGSSSSPGTAAASAASSGTFPVTIAAANGTVHIPARPTAIISLAPALTEMLYAVGAGHHVDRLDLVVESGDTGNLTKRLAAFKIPVLELPAPAALPGVYSEFTELGRATGHVAQAATENAAIRGQVAAIVAGLPHRSQPASYYYELDTTYYSVTSDTFVGHLLGLLGLKSIADAAKGAAAAGGYPQLSAEYILRANPDYILLADTICCHQSAATVAARPGWSSLTAVKDGHIILLNDDIASRWGPRIVDLLHTVAAALAKHGQ